MNTGVGIKDPGLVDETMGSRVVPTVRLERVTKVYPGGARALDQADLDIHPGEFIVIVGPSGAGKSTMLRCINLLVRPTQGRLVVAGEEIRGERGGQLRRVRGHVGMIFQQFGLVGRLSVLDNVLAGRLRFHSMPPVWGRRLARASGLGAVAILIAAAMGLLGTLPPTPALTIAGLGLIPVAGWILIWCWRVGPSTVRWFPRADRRAAIEALRAVGIEHLAERRADRLSGGQQQRVAIARTLAQEPHVVLADEPIASLDPVSADAVMDSLAKINRERGIPIVVNLHQVDVARRYATRIVGMSAGRIVFDGPACDLTEAIVDRIYKGDPIGAATNTDPQPPPTRHAANTLMELTPARPGTAGAAI